MLKEVIETHTHAQAGAKHRMKTLLPYKGVGKSSQEEL